MPRVAVQLRPYFPAIVTALVIFVADIYLPLGVTTGVLYVLPVVMVMGSRRRGIVLLTATVATLLTLLEYLQLYWGADTVSPRWVVEINRIISVVAIWIAAGVVLVRLRESEQLVKETAENLHIKTAALDSSINAAVYANFEGNLLYVNDAFLRLSGYEDRSEILGRHATAFAENADEVLRTLHDSGGWLGELEIIRKDGSHLPIQLSATIVSDATGKPIGLMGFFVDISSRRAAENRLRSSETLLSEAQRIAHVGHWDWDIVTNGLAWSDEIYRIFGLEPQQFGATYDAFLDRVHPEDRESVQEAVNAAIYQKEKYSIQHRVIRPDGELRYVHERGEVTYRDDGTPVRMVGTVHDITNSVLAQEALERYTRELKAMFDALPDMFFWLNREGRYLWAHSSDPSKFLLSPEQFMGKRLAEVLPEPLGSIAEENIHKALESKETVTFEYFLEKHGRNLCYEARMLPVGSNEVLCVVRDITEQELALRELKESRRQMATLFETLPGMAYRCLNDPNWTLEIASKGIEDLTGYPASAFIEECAIHYADLIHPDDKDHVWNTVQAAIAERKPFLLSYRIRSANGQEKSVWEQGQGVFREDGTLEALEGFVMDISARVQAEEQRLLLERKLFESQRLESLGLMAGGVAHDFNNILAAIRCDTEMALMRMPRDNDSRKHLEHIETSTLRATELTNQLLVYTGRMASNVQPAHLGEISREMVDLVSAVISKKARLKFETDENIPLAMADVSQLRQVVMNLITNASDALDGREGTITLRSGVMDVDRRFLARCRVGEDLPAGSYAYLEVEDTGVGMNDLTLEKIFDPFFSTKAAGRGLGLAGVLGIIRTHNGALYAESVPSKGARFRILLPVPQTVQAQPENVEKKEILETRPIGAATKGCILIIDDEVGVREGARSLLEAWGYTAVTAGNGRTGVSLFEKQRDEIDAVVVDMLMPDINGDEVIPRLREIRPDIPIVLCSGFLSDRGILDKLDSLRVRFLAKPFTGAQLAGIIEAAILDLSKGNPNTNRIIQML